MRRIRFWAALSASRPEAYRIKHAPALLCRFPPFRLDVEIAIMAGIGFSFVTHPTLSILGTKTIRNGLIGGKNSAVTLSTQLLGTEEISGVADTCNASRNTSRSVQTDVRLPRTPGLRAVTSEVQYRPGRAPAHGSGTIVACVLWVFSCTLCHNTCAFWLSITKKETRHDRSVTPPRNKSHDLPCPKLTSVRHTN